MGEDSVMKDVDDVPQSSDNVAADEETEAPQETGRINEASADQASIVNPAVTEEGEQAIDPTHASAETRGTGQAVQAGAEISETTNDAVSQQQPAAVKEEGQDVPESQVNVSGVPHAVPEPAKEATESTNTPAIVTASRDAQANNVSTSDRPSSASTSASTTKSQVAASANGGGAGTSNGSPARVYLKEQVNDHLLEGMKWLALTRPSNGLLALGQYLCSADAWRNTPKNANRSVHEFHSYWLGYQQWRDQGHADKTEQDYQATL